MVEQHGTEDWTLIASHLQVSETLSYIADMNDLGHGVTFAIFQKCVYIILDLGFLPKNISFVLIFLQLEAYKV